MGRFRVEKMTKIQADLDYLTGRALEHGAAKAKAFLAEKVVVDPRVRLKCSVPVCAGYRNNLMCPPNVISPDQFSLALAKYHDAILVQFKMPMPASGIKKKFGDQELKQMVEDKDYLQSMVKEGRSMEEAMGKLERDAMLLGYRFAAAFGGGPCRLCDECVALTGGTKCRNPWKARPAMEAVGIDVFMTAKNAGLPFEIPAKENPVLVGLLLVD
jgi:predicted metal-binding protein